MPRRIWVMMAAIVVVLGAAFIALTVAVPDPEAVVAASGDSPASPDAVAVGPTEAAVVPAADSNEVAVPAPVALPAEPPATTPAAGPPPRRTTGGMAAAAPVVNSTGEDGAAALSRDLVMVAEAEQAQLPRTEGRLTRVSATAAGRELTLTYDMAIDPAVFDLEADKVVLTPGFEAYRCESGTCFRFISGFQETTCYDPSFESLLARGAAVIHVYRDVNQRPVTGAEFRVDWNICFTG